MADTLPFLPPRVEPAGEDGVCRVTFDPGTYDIVFGTLEARVEEGEPRRARVTIPTDARFRNAIAALHGGLLLAYVDQAVFVAVVAMGLGQIGEGVTLSISAQFIGLGRIGVPLDCLAVLARETKRLFFFTGTLEQEGRVILTFQATLNKLTPQR